MKKVTISIVTLAALALASMVVAQDFSLEPAFGTYDLTSGFEPDPQALELTAGGTIDASALGEGCVGSIADAPDVRVNFTVGTDGLPLTFIATAEADTTLVINGPDGLWYCNDDTDEFNPVVSFTTPASGQYDIWVGTYATEPAPAVISVTELR